MPAPDSNIGFTLTPQGRSQLIRVLDFLSEALPQATAILIDRAGRIVDVARRPIGGVNLEAISALAAGCYASTRELGKTMADEEFSLLFEHEDDQQMYVWPVSDRALLVMLLKGSAAVDQLEERMEGKLGAELNAVVNEGRAPLQAVPPPRVSPLEVPADLTKKMSALTVLIMDLQAKRAAELTGEINARLLKARDDLGRALGMQNWEMAGEICESTKKWLASAFPQR
jgi:predicted regulator of Ras-like GTPase activity (Roadblock/LC7/MglB family)